MVSRRRISFSGTYSHIHGDPVCRNMCGEDRKDKRILPETAGERRAATARCDCGGKQAVPGFPAVNRIQGHGCP